jgi:hypothetical protein
MLTPNTNSQLLNSLLKSLETQDLLLVTFLTKAGTHRVMGCTRKRSAIPSGLYEGIYEPKLNSDSIVCVFDFQNLGFRSFRKDSIISFECIE